ncbi:MAG: LD-carboxypeptidase [Saprospiraceae bacterium]|nr:LD-carboxypeptidase [Saprospiraceae bacterium]
MQRRKFVQQAALLTVMAGACSTTTTSTSRLFRPRRLRSGDLIGLTTPGSYIPDGALEKAVKNAESLGFRVKLSKNIRAKRGYNAGTDAQRLEDLHELFADKEVAGIWCARGGYGCTRLLPKLDYSLIRRNPKALIGYSDVTALLLAIFRETGLITFHGPVAASDLTEYSRARFKAVLMEPQQEILISIPEALTSQVKPEYQSKTIRGGKASGVLSGGNLSLLASLAGTPHSPDFSGKIVFMEDVEERPYRIDRMLTQLRQACNLEKAAGIVMGVFIDCLPEDDVPSLTLMETLEDQLAGLGIPVVYGMPVGHISNQCVLPVGVSVNLNADQKTLTLSESGVL